MKFQRYSQIEDQFEELKRNHEEKLLSLESLVKIFEIKSRSATDHITRLEEKENEMKSEYKRLHDRYNEVKQRYFFVFALTFPFRIESKTKAIQISLRLHGTNENSSRFRKFEFVKVRSKRSFKFQQENLSIFL